MPAYGIAHIRPDEHRNDEVVAYLERIQATMDPYEGRFLVHGTEVEVVEGNWPGTIVIIEFPDVEKARDWYDSDAYQDILPLRTRNVPSDVILVPGVRPGYDAKQTAAASVRGARSATA